MNSKISVPALAMVFSIVMGMSACTFTGEPKESDASSTTDSSDGDEPKRVTTKVSSDGGKARIGASALTPLKKSEFGPSISTPIAVEVTNKSETDLLYFGNVELTLRGSSGESITRSHNDIHMLLPGETTIYGYVEYPDFKATELDGKITDTQWYPTSSLKALEADLRVKMTQSTIDVREDSVVGTGKFRTYIDRKDDGGLTGRFEFFRRVVMRDSSGELLGVYDDDGVYATAESAGIHSTDIEIDKDSWPPNADPKKSDVVISWFSGFKLGKPER